MSRKDMYTVAAGFLSLTILFTVAGDARAQSGAAYAFLNDRIDESTRTFFLYNDLDDGQSQGAASGWFGSRERLTVDSGCVDDPNDDVTGCSRDRMRTDCDRGTVLRMTWAPQSTIEYAGLNIEDPEGYGITRAGVGHDLRGAASLVFHYRSPTGIRVQFGFAGGTTAMINIDRSRQWREMRIPLATGFSGVTETISDVHLLMTIVTNGENAPSGGTLLLDQVRFEPTPIAFASTPAFPRANVVCGVIPAHTVQAGRVAIPPDQVNRSLTTQYESAIALLALLARRSGDDIANARELADALVYAQQHDNSGLPLPRAWDGSRGWRNAYLSIVPLKNDQPGGARQGEARLAGFSADRTLCGPTGFCLVLDGATGGNTAFTMLSLLKAYRHFGDSRYLESAREGARWIIGTLQDGDPSGYRGFFVGYPDEGQSPKVLNRGKSIENNADIAAALLALAAIERDLGNVRAADDWTTRAYTAADFVIDMFDGATGRFYAGTVPAGTLSQPGICADGPRRGGEVINTCDFLDANTFSVLALAEVPRYRNALDWRRPVQWSAAQSLSVNSAGVSYRGFSIVNRPVSGPTGIAPEFTGQMVVAMRLVDRLYGETRFSAAVAAYLDELRRVRAIARFGNGRGLVAAVLEDVSAIPPYEQCLSTPFQCIAQRVGLAATVWGIFAEDDINPFR